MNFVKSSILVVITLKAQIIFCLFLTLSLSIYLSGCSDEVTLSSAEQLVEFKNAGPLRPTVDLDRLVKAKISGDPYRVIPGEVLELTMPAILRVITTDESIGTDKDSLYICRISESGTITLPVIGEIEVVGKTLAQIETDVIDAYYPEYALTRPSVFARVLEYMTAKVSISGAVQRPGMYSLRSDQMSLVSLLMEAGGIIDEGAALIRISHSEEETEPDSKKITEELKQQEIEQIPEPINTELIDSSTPYLSSNKIGAQLSFKRSSAQNTIGIMTITYDDKVLLIEQMDITNEIERLIFLKQLSWKEPRVSTNEVEQKLSELAESLKSRSGRSRENSNAYIKTLEEIDNSRNKSWTLHENNTEQEPQVFIKTAQQPFVLPELPKRNNSLNYSSAGKNARRNIFSNATFNTSKTEKNLTTDVAINEELLEIPNMVTNQEAKGKGKSDEIREPESLVLPIKGFNIPFTDVALQDGDNVIVERLEQPFFSVIGLVNRPGNFSYPPNAQYNLMQALAFAGGLDPAAEPRYATIYRLKSDGTITNATFEIINVKNSSQLTDALNIHIKPGDILSVEHTPRTRSKLFMDRVFRINMGTYFRLNDVWDE